MTFRAVVWNSALCGGWFALLGWVLGRVLWPMLEIDHPLLQTGFNGACLGLCVALGLSFVDIQWNRARRVSLGSLARLNTAALVGAAGGFLGGLGGQALSEQFAEPVYLVPGWAFTGMLVGFAVGAFDLLRSRSHKDRAGTARRKVFRGVFGGLLGGVLGGFAALSVRDTWTPLFENRPPGLLWSPGGTGFVVLGSCIGYVIGLMQVIMKDAWVQVESGFRAGRELLLTRQSTVIGRDGTADIALFGDPDIEPTHARIELHEGRYMLADGGAPGGTWLNGRRITEPTPLRSGDLIQVGRSTLRFSEWRRHD